LKFEHKPVMLKECIENLNIKPDGIYVDGTLGGAGHSIEIIKKLTPSGKLIAIDKDDDAINASKQKMKNFKNVTYIKGNHDDIKLILKDLNINKVDGILLDLGVSSYQIDEKDRGFSYIKDATLDMRMDKNQILDAKYIVNNYTEDQLTDIFYKYGEEKFSKKISKAICEYRRHNQIKTTLELSNIIQKNIPIKYQDEKNHPSKRVFQAIRIEVNNEIRPLYNTVKDCIDVLNNKGRLCIITFHSLEDRIVKNAYNDSLGKCTCPKDLPQCICNNIKMGKVITKKPLLASKEELENNSRAKSAKLRVFEKI